MRVPDGELVVAELRVSRRTILAADERRFTRITRGFLSVLISVYQQPVLLARERSSTKPGTARLGIQTSSTCTHLMFKPALRGKHARFWESPARASLDNSPGITEPPDGKAPPFDCVAGASRKVENCANGPRPPDWRIVVAAIPCGASAHRPCSSHSNRLNNCEWRAGPLRGRVGTPGWIAIRRRSRK